MTVRERFEADIALVKEARDAFTKGDWGQCFVLLDAFLQFKRRCSDQDWAAWAKQHLTNAAIWIREDIAHQTLIIWSGGNFKTRDDMKEFIRDKAKDTFGEDHAGALRYLSVSDNSDVVVDDGGRLYVTANNVVDWVGMAVLALSQDVIDELWHEHIYGDTEPPQEVALWCDFCEKWRPTRGRQVPPGEFACDECSDPEAY